MKELQENKGITLIALVITIIVLLILAGISIATLTGENGILTKANKAEKDADIVETKEQIKLEIMGNLDDKKSNYTNQDVINAVKKITNQDVEKDTKTVKSLKGNDVDIQDLWLEEKLVTFWINEDKYQVAEGTTWINFLRNNPTHNLIVQDLPGISGNVIAVVYVKGTHAFEGYANGGSANVVVDSNKKRVLALKQPQDNMKYEISIDFSLNCHTDNDFIELEDCDPQQKEDYGFGYWYD